MNKQELIDAVAESAGVPRADASRYLDALLETITDQLKGDNEVRIPGFGKFYARRREARQGRNPQTGQPMTIPASKTPSFSAGSALKNSL